MNEVINKPNMPEPKDKTQWVIYGIYTLVSIGVGLCYYGIDKIVEIHKSSDK